MKRTALKRHTALSTGKQLATNGTGLRRRAHSTEPPTPTELALFAKMRWLGCLACRINRLNGRAVVMQARKALEIHHQLSGRRRIGHHAVICLCHYHHQGKRLPMITMGYREHAQKYGPSLERESRAFAAMYGDQETLLAMQISLLEGVL